MSDVTQGGATVFPALNLALWPKKGTAAFWFNLHASGEGDYLTRHAACPVLTGSKWGEFLAGSFVYDAGLFYRNQIIISVSNKWLHELDQEFLRPCELLPDHPDM